MRLWLKLTVLILLPILISTTNLPGQFKLPEGNFEAGWEIAGAPLVFHQNDLYGYINGGAELFHEFGFEKLIVQSYHHHGEELTLEVYQMENPTAALGIYLMKCGTETPLAGIDARHTGSRLQATIVKNNLFIQINNFSGAAHLLPVMTKLGTVLLDSTAPAETPTILTLLPAEQLIKGSERIFRGPYGLEPVFTFGNGDVFQQDGKIFAVLGKYQLNDTTAITKIFIPYPDENSAKIAFKNVASRLDPYLQIIGQQEQALIFKDYQNLFGKIFVTDNVLKAEIFLPVMPQ